MHESVQNWIRSWAERLPVGQHVLEVGSCDVNGSVRPTIVGALVPASYLGVDLAEGKGVDLVLPGGIETLCTERPAAIEHFGLVVSTEMLEHARDWRAAVTTMRRCLAPGGWLLLTARGPGFFRHCHKDEFEGDYWRFTKQDFLQMARCLGLEVYDCIDDPQVPGVFMACRAPEWPDPMPEPGWVRR